MANIIIGREKKQLLKDLVELTYFNSIGDNLPFNKEKNCYTFSYDSDKYRDFANKVLSHDEKDSNAKTLCSFYTDRGNISQFVFHQIMTYAMEGEKPNKQYYNLNDLNEEEIIKKIISKVKNYNFEERLKINTWKESLEEANKRLEETNERLNLDLQKNKNRFNALLCLLIGVFGFFSFLFFSQFQKANNQDGKNVFSPPQKGDKLGDLELLFRMKDTALIWDKAKLSFYNTLNTSTQDTLFVEAKGIYRDNDVLTSFTSNNIEHLGICYKLNGFYQIELRPKDEETWKRYGKVYYTIIEKDLDRKLGLVDKSPIYGIGLGISNYPNDNSDISNITSYIFKTKQKDDGSIIKILDDLSNKIDTNPKIKEEKYKRLRLFMH